MTAVSAAVLARVAEFVADLNALCATHDVTFALSSGELIDLRCPEDDHPTVHLALERTTRESGRAGVVGVEFAVVPK